jgi:hypothetical protein
MRNMPAGCKEICLWMTARRLYGGTPVFTPVAGAGALFSVTSGTRAANWMTIN